jgi:hypothetical protein
MPELTAVLVAKKESDHENRKFLAAIQGIDIDKESKGSSNPWEDMKARVFSGGLAESSDDILSMQGANAQRAGFGIGAGLEYSNAKSSEPANPFS